YTQRKYPLSTPRTNQFSLCNEPDPLFKPNGTNSDPVARLSCLHSFHLRCIIISLKNDLGCPHCCQPIYFEDDDDGKQILSEDEYIVEKLFRNLAKEPQNFELLPRNLV
ncbi:14653_t:CDS:1, partial [Cetraspora pellucida]